MKKLIDIAYLSVFSQSSTSDRELFRKGSPIDGSQNDERFSVHTDKECNPFIVFCLPFKLPIKLIKLNLRKRYAFRSLPLEVLYSSNGKWEKIATIQSKNCAVIFPEQGLFSGLKIVSPGFKSLDMSSIQIFVEHDAFIKEVSRFRKCLGGVIYAYSDFFGLGGQLSVLASALGYAGSQSDQKNVFCDSSLRHIVDYPVPHKWGDDESLEDFISVWASEAVSGFLKENSYRSERNISLHYATLPRLSQQQKFSFISRNRIDIFGVDGESETSLKQRLYKRIVPSEKVVKREAYLQSVFKINFDHSIGLHFRHGNGEMYFREFDQHNRWGVKPPCAKKVGSAIREFLKRDESITTVVVCSDSLAATKLLRGELPENINIIFLSEAIQDIGCGCNHTPKVFDKDLSRVEIDRNLENTIAFAEILVLSQCRYLVGGTSFFFDAVIGFSEANPNCIAQLDTKERYVNLPKTYSPIAQADSKLAEQLKQRDILLDGLFLKTESGISKIFYFDSMLLKFKKTPQLSERQFEELNKLLEKTRGY